MKISTTTEELDFSKVKLVQDRKQIGMLVDYLYNTKNVDFDMGMALVYKRGISFYVFGDNYKASYHKVNGLVLWWHHAYRINRYAIKNTLELLTTVPKFMFNVAKIIFR